MKLSTITSVFIVVGTSSVINAELRGSTQVSQHRMAKQDKGTTAPSAAVGSKMTSSVKVKVADAKTKKVPSEKVADAKAKKVAAPQKNVSTTDIKAADAKAEKVASPSKTSKTTPKKIAGKSSKGSTPKKSSKSMKVSKSSKTQTAAPSADPLTSAPSADTLDTITIDSESESEVGVAGAFRSINIAEILLSDDEFSSMSMSMSL